MITVAGTNGKGSVAAYCTAMLEAAGYRVGTFTSPHLRDYRERIRIDDEKVVSAALLGAFERIEAARQRRRRGPSRLLFSSTTRSPRLLVFEAAGLDAWVLEVGMGGRLDAVNVVDPTVAVVVSIGLDHQEFLGATLEAIAREKAGIFRAAVPAVLGSRELPARARGAGARALGAPLKRLGSEFDFSRRRGALALSRHPLGPRRSAGAGARWARPNSPTLRPRSQRSRSFAPRLEISREAIARGLGAARLPGRFQSIGAAGADLDPGCRAQSRCGARARAQSCGPPRRGQDVRGVRHTGRQGCRGRRRRARRLHR